MGKVAEGIALLLILCSLIVTVTQSFVLPAYAQPTWNTHLVDDKGWSGSLAIDSYGNPHVLYSDFYVNNSYYETIYLKSNYVVWDGANWSAQSLDPAIINGNFALDSNNLPHIIYLDNNILKYAFFNGDNWIFQTIDSSATSFSTVLDSKGNPQTVYTTYGNGISYLKYAHLEGSRWSNKVITYLNTTGHGHKSVSIALDSSDNPQIIYLENIDYNFGKNGLWSTNNVNFVELSVSKWSIKTVASNVSQIYNVAVDATGKPSFCYVQDQNFSYTTDNSFRFDSSLNYANWDGIVWHTQALDSPSLKDGYKNGQAYLHLDSYDNPQIFFYTTNYSNQTLSSLMYLQWTGTNWAIQKLGNFPNIDDYYVDMAQIVDVAFDSRGNLNLLYGGEVGTIRSAAVFGQLTYASIELPGYTPTVLWTTIALIILSVILVFVTALLLFRRHRKTAGSTQ
ncbi:MAG: hypothetical protein NWE93_00475 [Candidatus Bathyarchaeota archaeon]|nr:hypothetical protein [Candidatus Bathyarchaeota archaeon]